MAPDDHARFCRAAHVPEVELVSVAHRERRFPEHLHDEFVIGAITSGAEELTVGGRVHHAPHGSVLRLGPGEVHANATCGDDTLRYAVLYVPPALFERHLGRPLSPASRFATPVVHHHATHRIVRHAHALLAARDADRLEQESAIAALIRAIGLPDALPASDRPAPAAVARARTYIDMHLAEGFGIETLSHVAGVSPFHLVRIFKHAIGLSPLAYRNQRRLALARHRLAEGDTPVAVALDLGFADQSHFTRHFQRIVGTSPKRYARQVGVPGRSDAGCELIKTGSSHCMD